MIDDIDLLNADYWITKIEKNMLRDRQNDQLLSFQGWTVIHFWGKEITKNTEYCVRIVEDTIFENMIQNTALD